MRILAPITIGLLLLLPVFPDHAGAGQWLGGLDLERGDPGLKSWGDDITDQALERVDPGLKSWTDDMTRRALERAAALAGESESRETPWEDIDAATAALPQTLEARPGLPPVMVFVSFSMPRESLKGWAAEAAQAGIPLVLRGLKENKMKPTMAAIHDLVGENNRGAVLIDPTLFRRFQIESVPTVVVAAEAVSPCSSPGCESEPVPAHDRIAGNITLDAALRMIGRGEGEAEAAAQAALARLEARP